MPAYSAVVFGITTAIATFGALIANIIAGLVLKRPVLEDWRKLFILFSIIYFIGGIVYVLFGSAEPRKWATFKAAQGKNGVNDQIPEEESVLMQQPSAPIKSPEIQLA